MAARVVVEVEESGAAGSSIRGGDKDE